jgi:glycoside/pentoside/hexuronide:cation symporter, GPH family
MTLPSGRLGIGLKLAYGLGSVPFGVKDVGLNFFLLIYYNQVLGLSASWVGFASATALAIDAAIDPLIGHWSDNLRSRWGRRHPLMYVALVPIAIAFGLLWDPPAALSPPLLSLYLIGMIILVRPLLSLYDVPSAALGPELTRDYDERTSLVGYRVAFGLIGGIGMVALALIAFLRPADGSVPGQLVAAGYVKYGWASAIVMVAAGLISALGTHHRIRFLSAPPPWHGQGLRHSLNEIVRSLWHRPLLMLLLAILSASLAQGLNSTLGFYYLTFFWELKPFQALALVLSVLFGAMLAVPLGNLLSRRCGKKAAASGIVIVALVNGPLPQLLRLADWFPANGSGALLPLLFLHGVVASTLGISALILIISMITDIVEATQLATGRRSEGLLLAMTAFAAKFATGLGLLISGLLIDFIRFPTHAVPGQVDPAILRNLVLTYTPVTTLLYLIMLAFLSTNRIDRATHEDNLRRLAETELAGSLND